MNELILSKDNLVIKRLWNLDTNTYAAGALDEKTKELLGLVAGTLTVFLLSLAGIPLTAGFMAKFYMLKAALGTPQRVRHNGVPVIHASEF